MDNDKNKLQKVVSLYDWCMNNNRQDLIDEWDYEKNGDLTPQNISCGSNLKVWWIKSYDDPNTNKHFNFSWQTSVHHRKEGKGCPYLSKPPRKILAGYNDLSTVRPDLALEWAYEENEKIGLDIYNVSYGSAKEAFWKCEKHGVYKSKISSRNDGNGCPFCSGKKVLVGKNDLLTLYPNLAKEWDYSKNEIKPTEVTIGSIKKIWWKCEKGHSWRTTVNNRTSLKTGCPFCTNRKVLAGFNDLSTTHPQIIKEWNYEKNILTPQEIVAMSNKIVWWRCSYGHEYKSAVCTKVMNNTLCPVCTKERRTSFAEKAIYFYIKKYFDDALENAKFKWLGKKELDVYIPSLKVAIEYDGNYWHSKIEKDKIKDDLCDENNITLIRVRENKCPMYESSSKKIIFNDNKKNEFLDNVLKNVFEFINQKYNLLIVPDINITRDYSIILNHYVTNMKEKNLALFRPDLAKEWDYEKNIGLKPEFMAVFSNKKVWWKCPKCKCSYQMMINDRTGDKHGNCPICASKRVVKGVNDLFTTNPELKDQWDYEKNTISPFNITRGSDKKVWWKCEKGHSWKTTVYVRTSMKCGCPICAGQKVDGNNSFANLYPGLLEEWDYHKNERDPFTVLPNSNLKYWWKCKKCGYEWQQNLSHRTARKSGCPLCAHQVLVPGINDLATQFPDIAEEWNYEKNTLRPNEVSGGTNKKYWWRCKKCGHEWECIVASRTKRGSSCPQCRKNRE